jgi:hypothetical protein
MEFNSEDGETYRWGNGPRFGAVDELVQTAFGQDAAEYLVFA